MKKQKSKIPKGKTDWEIIKSLTDEDVSKAAKSDPDAKLSTGSELKTFKRVNPPRSVDVAAIRKKLNLTQENFAKYFGVNKRTIQEWEQGRRNPNTMAKNLLKVINFEPKIVNKALSLNERKPTNNKLSNKKNNSN